MAFWSTSPNSVAQMSEAPLTSFLLLILPPVQSQSKGYPVRLVLRNVAAIWGAPSTAASPGDAGVLGARRRNPRRASQGAPNCLEHLSDYLLTPSFIVTIS